MKKIKANKNAHTSNSKVGSGDFYGQAIKNQTGRLIDSYSPDYTPMTNKKLGNAPKSLA